MVQYCTQAWPHTSGVVFANVVTLPEHQESVWQCCHSLCSLSCGIVRQCMWEIQVWCCMVHLTHKYCLLNHRFFKDYVACIYRICIKLYHAYIKISDAL